MRAAIDVQRARTFNDRNVPPLRVAEAFYLATAGGARALGKSGAIGTLEVGKEADVTVMDMSAVRPYGETGRRGKRPVEGRRPRALRLSRRPTRGRRRLRSRPPSLPTFAASIAPMNNDSADPIAIALAEDIGTGDITSEAFVPASLQALARIVARDRAVVAGTATAAEVFRRVDARLHVDVLQPDGSALSGGETILEIRGAARSILTAERVALNFLQRLSGIATLTRHFVEGAGKAKAQILDTRKTTPGLRALEKAAVVAGGGANHRFGLYDMVLVKDNHLMAAPGSRA
jgi:hypothetical protein